MKLNGPFAIGVSLLAVACAGSAAAQQTAVPLMPPPKAVPTLPSCASGDELRFQQGEVSALLDDGDTAMVFEALANRYPVLQRDGFAPERIVLWQKGSGELLYVALQRKPDSPGHFCFSATFAASRFELTVPLVRKYFYLTTA
jgi:hypothetical protein